MRGFGYGMGGGLLTSILPLAIIVVVVLIVFAISKGKRGGHARLILEEFIFNGNEDEFLKIKGRASGFWNWVLSLFDKAPITIFSCNKKLIKYEENKIKYNIPLANITCVSSAMLKSSVLLPVLGIILIISVVAFPIGIILIIVYALNKKTMQLGIYISENKPMVTISMKRGIINSIDNEKFENAAKVLNEVVLANVEAK